jgi:hypothetical protein
VLSKVFAAELKLLVKESREKQFAKRSHDRAMAAIGNVDPTELTLRQNA